MRTVMMTVQMPIAMHSRTPMAQTIARMIVSDLMESDIFICCFGFFHLCCVVMIIWWAAGESVDQQATAVLSYQPKAATAELLKDN